MERLAILGGTFDPIHAGHLRMAHAIQKQLEFDSIVFLPAFKPPHKQVRHDFAPFEDRLAMVSLAIQPYEAFTVSSLEAERGGLSYTFDTVCCLQELWPDADIYMIIGEDSLDQLYTGIVFWSFCGWYILWWPSVPATRAKTGSRVWWLSAGPGRKKKSSMRKCRKRRCLLRRSGSELKKDCPCEV